MFSYINTTVTSALQAQISPKVQFPAEQCGQTFVNKTARISALPTLYDNKFLCTVYAKKTNSSFAMLMKELECTSWQQICRVVRSAWLLMLDVWQSETHEVC